MIRRADAGYDAAMANARSWLVSFLGLGERQGGYPPTLNEELNVQAWKILRLSSLICAVAWLPYVPIDRAIHPELSALLYLRLGLSVVGVLGLVVSFLPAAQRFAGWALLAVSVYLECAAGLITGLCGGDSIYLGGFLFVLMLVPLVPLRREHAWALVGASNAVFWVSGRAAGMHFEGARGAYQVQDLTSTAIVSAVFIYLCDHLRRRSWIKGRTVQLQSEEMAKDKAKIDSLLLNILPAPIADELKTMGSVKPVFHREATIVFADFVGFTSRAATMHPGELLATLDAFFSRFDAIMDRYGVEKLKTIGDAYMYASGLPARTRTHAIDACLAAMHILRDVEEHADAGFGGVRIGVHSGPLMAGMVGSKKFAYDVWGDAVNTASRLESTSDAGRINVSKSTCDLVSDFFIVTQRGPLSVKGKGMMDAYFLDRIRPELSADERGVEPNDLFWERYRKLRNQAATA